jgi:hypothetical protein
VTSAPRTREPLVLAWLIGLAPVVILLLTWDRHGASSVWARTIREYALPMLAIEAIVIGVASLAGLFRWTWTAPAVILVAAAGWLIVAFGTAWFVAGYPRLSLFLTFVWVLHALFGAAVAFLCGKGKLDPVELAPAIIAGFIIYALAAAIFALQADPTINFVADMPGLGNLRRLAAYATLAGALALGMFLWGRRWLALVAATLAFFTVFWTGGRATTPAILAAVMAAFVLFPSARDRSLPIGALLAALIGLVLALAFPADAGKGNDAVRVLADTSDNGRIRLWRESVRAIAAAPVFGHGEGQTALVLPDNPNLKDDFQAHPHNFFLQSLMAWGVVGTVFVLVLAGWLAILLHRAGRSRAALPFVIGAGALAVHAMVDGALYDVAPVYLFAACVGAACSVGIKSGEQR